MNTANRPSRRTFLLQGLAPFPLGMLAAGCRSLQFARVTMPGEDAMIGSHQAGQDTCTPLVNDAVAKLLARHVDMAVQPVRSDDGSEMASPVRRVCFVGVENKSAEDIGDFKERIYQSIDSRILESSMFQPVNRRFVDAGLRDTSLRPDQVLLPEHMRAFAAHMEQQGQPIDYLLYATITSGTTRKNRGSRRDYVLTLELVETATGTYDRQSSINMPAKVP